MTSEPQWTEGVQQFFTEHWAKAMQNFAQMGVAPVENKNTAVQFDPAKIQQLQQQYIEQASRLWSAGVGTAPAVPKDKRFAGEGWAKNPVAAFTASAYMLNAQALAGMADAVQADEKNPPAHSLCC